MAGSCLWGVWGRQVRVLEGTGGSCLCLWVSWPWGVPASLVILISKRASRPLTGGRLAQCRDGLTKKVETSNRVKGSTISRRKDTGGESDVDAALTSTSTPRFNRRRS